MALVELESFDILTADAGRILAPYGFLAELARATPTGTARLVVAASPLAAADVLAGYHQVALPEEALEGPLRHYEREYRHHLATVVETTRRLHLYFMADVAGEGSALSASERLAARLAAYGLTARPLAGSLPLPFEEVTLDWNRLHALDGTRWAIVRSRRTQVGAFGPTVLHRLLALPYPLWLILDIGTLGDADAEQQLRLKDTAARYERAQATEAQAAAADVRATIAQFRAERVRDGAALHEVRLSVLVGAETEPLLQARLAEVRAVAGLSMSPVEEDAAHITKLFTPTAPPAVEGSLLTTMGLTILVGSALSYRRASQTRGVLLGLDNYQAPVILDLFDPRLPSYNAVVLGQTGFGKTFAVLLLMLRHLFLGKRLVILDPQGNIDLSWLGENAHHAALGQGGNALNVLDIVQPELAQQVELVSAMLGLLRVANPDDGMERALLDEVLLDLYLPLWDVPNLPAMPTLRHLRTRLEERAESAPVASVREVAAEMAYRLAPYVDGSLADLFGRETTVDFSLAHPATVFNLAGLPKEELGHLRTALLSILVGNLHRAIARRRAAGDATQTLMFIDEIGILMRDEVVARFVSEQYKTARSRGVGMIVADQELTSFCGTSDRRGMRHGRMMLATALTRLLFNQTGGDLPLVAETFPEIPAALLNQLPRYQQGWCLAQIAGEVRQVRVTASRLEAAALSSQLHDRARMQRVLARFEADAVRYGDEVDSAPLTPSEAEGVLYATTPQGDFHDDQS